MNILLAITLAATPLQGDTITVNPAVQYQTMTGWEATDYAGQELDAFANFKDEVIQRVVNQVGVQSPLMLTLTRYRCYDCAEGGHLYG